VGKFFDPQYLPNFGLRELFVLIEIQRAHFRFQFQDPNPKIGAWGDDRRNKKKSHFLIKWAYFKSVHRQEY